MHRRSKARHSGFRAGKSKKNRHKMVNKINKRVEPGVCTAMHRPWKVQLSCVMAGNQESKGPRTRFTAPKRLQFKINSCLRS